MTLSFNCDVAAHVNGLDQWGQRDFPSTVKNNKSSVW